MRTRRPEWSRRSSIGLWASSLQPDRGCPRPPGHGRGRRVLLAVQTPSQPGSTEVQTVMDHLMGCSSGKGLNAASSTIGTDADLGDRFAGHRLEPGSQVRSCLHRFLMGGDRIGVRVVANDSRQVGVPRGELGWFTAQGDRFDPHAIEAERIPQVADVLDDRPGVSSGSEFDSLDAERRDPGAYISENFHRGAEPCVKIESALSAQHPETILVPKELRSPLPAFPLAWSDPSPPWTEGGRYTVNRECGPRPSIWFRRRDASLRHRCQSSGR